jgi:hypothetical protein
MRHLPVPFTPVHKNPLLQRLGVTGIILILIYSLYKKKESVAVSMQLVKRDKYVFMWKCIVFKTIMIIKICFPD